MDVRLPEAVEREIADGCTGDDAHDSPPCPRCTRLRRAIAAALLRARVDEHTKHQCMTDGESTCYCGRDEGLTAQADALDEVTHDRRG